MTMDKPKMIELLKEIEKDIYVSSLESTFKQDAKSCAIHEAIEILQKENCEDAISRQKVIDIIVEELWAYDGASFIIYAGIITGKVEKMPSVNPILKESPENFNKSSETESMLNADLISRRVAIEEIRNLKISVAGKDVFPNEAKETIIKTLDELPSVQPEQRTGHWIDTGNYFMGAYGNIDYVECSCCHEDSLEEGDYCPNCGAKMEEGE